MYRLREQWKIFKDHGRLTLYHRVLRLISGVLDAYHLHLSESFVTNVLAIVVGILTGYGAVLFRWLITVFTNFGNDIGTLYIQNLFPFLGKFAFVPVPVIGMVLVVLIVENFAKEAKGHGVPEVMEAVAMRGGRIRGRVAVIKSLTSSICIGFGGSVGREGPIVQIGSAIGSATASVLRMSSERRKWLVACGAGAGIAATFNAPIAGVIFAMEVILHGSTLRSFASIVLATVSGSVIGRMYFGKEAAFVVPQYAYESNLEIVFYLILGLAAAIVGIIYTRSVYFSEDLFTKFRIHPVLKGAIGGLLIGVVASFWPEVRGVGYESITMAVNDHLLWQVMLVLMVTKIAATSLTLGAGGSGGIFAPALFIGAMLGGTLGTGFEALAPGLTAGSGPYAMVGMAAVFSAAARAPFSAIVILFELTGNYNIILPLMLSVVIATTIANHFQHDSIYTLKLIRRGIRLNWGASVDILENLKVRDVMQSHIDSVRVDLPKKELYIRFMETHHNGFPVVDENNRLVGIVTLNDYHNAGRFPPFAPVDRFCSHNLLTAFPDDDLSSVLKKMRIRDIGRLPVVSRQDNGQILGIITRSDILFAYDLALKRLQTDDTPLDLS